jgi:hypothetical protein
MLNRVIALCVLSVGFPSALLRAQDLFVLPGTGAAGSEVQAFVTNPLTTFRTFSAGAGSFALVPNPAASKYFVIASSSTNSVVAMDGALLTPTLVANLPMAASQALVTPDGKLLAVAAGTVHLFNAVTNAELISGGFSQGLGFNTFAIAASFDSTSIFALGSKAAGTSQLTAINTSTYTATATLPLTQAATAVSVGPNGLVYLSLPNQIIEVDPRTLQPTFNGTISVSGTPGPLVFTPDGQYAIGANQSTFGNSLLIAALATHTATDPNVGLPQLTSLQVTGVDTVLALSNQGLYEVNLSTPISISQIQIPNLTGTGLVALTSSNDVPAGAHTTVQDAYVVSANTVYQFNPSAQAITAQYPIAPNVVPGAVAYAVPAQTTATSRAYCRAPPPNRWSCKF